MYRQQLFLAHLQNSLSGKKDKSPSWFQARAVSAAVAAVWPPGCNQLTQAELSRIGRPRDDARALCGDDAPPVYARKDP